MDLILIGEDGCRHGRTGAWLTTFRRYNFTDDWGRKQDPPGLNSNPMIITRFGHLDFAVYPTGLYCVSVSLSFLLCVCVCLSVCEAV